MVSTLTDVMPVPSASSVAPSCAGTSLRWDVLTGVLGGWRHGTTTTITAAGGDATRVGNAQITKFARAGRLSNLPKRTSG